MSDINDVSTEKITLLNNWVNLVSGSKVGDFIRKTLGGGLKNDEQNI